MRPQALLLSTHLKSLLLLLFSIVEFSSRSDMNTALEKLDDTEINGRRIRLVEESSRNRRRRYAKTSFLLSLLFILFLLLQPQ